MVNIGCDETFDLGQGKSKALCDRIGKYNVYLDFVLKICNDLLARGYKVQFWGDIVLEKPEVIHRIPKGVIALNWGYEADHSFELEASRFEEAGIPFYVCPGTSSWLSLAGRTDNALGNLLNAAEAGLKHGASGYLITDWGDKGHWQSLPVSYLGIIAGAGLAWSLEANRNLDLPTALNRHAFEDAAGVMGELAYELGNIYQLPGLARNNASELLWILQSSPEQLNQAQQQLPQTASPHQLNYLPETTLVEALDQIDRIMAPLHQSRMPQPEAELIKREYRLTANLMRLACRRALLALEPQQFQSEYASEISAIIKEYTQVWLSRNQPGGLADSLIDLLKLQNKTGLEPVYV
jgi:hexosaminidase